MRNKSIILFANFIFFFFLQIATAQDDMVQESSTDKMFPRKVTFSVDTTEYNLTITGTAVRKKFIIKVYGMAHYIQNSPTGKVQEVIDSILSSDAAKQFTLDFARDVGPDKIQGAFRDGFKKNASDEELETIQTDLDAFIGYFAKEVKENEQYIFRWLPDGTLISIIQEEEFPAIQNKTLAKILWKIWLGKDSIVDEKKLVSLQIEN
jgi:hypothetical protein